MPAVRAFKDDVVSGAEAIARHKATRKTFFPSQPAPAVQQTQSDERLRVKYSLLQQECNKLKEDMARLRQENWDLRKQNGVMRKSLSDFLCGHPDVPEMLNIKDVQRAVAQYFRMGVPEMLATSRSAPRVKARQIAFFLSRRLTAKSLPQIGASFGGKDHTTVLHGIRKLEPLWRAIEGQVGGRSLVEVIHMIDIEWDRQYGPSSDDRKRVLRDNSQSSESDEDTFRSIGEIANEIVENLESQQQGD